MLNLHRDNEYWLWFVLAPSQTEYNFHTQRHSPNLFSLCMKIVFCLAGCKYKPHKRRSDCRAPSLMRPHHQVKIILTRLTSFFESLRIKTGVQSRIGPTKLLTATWIVVLKCNYCRKGWWSKVSFSYPGLRMLVYSARFCRPIEQEFIV